jgi:hypothetical protein
MRDRYRFFPAYLVVLLCSLLPVLFPEAWQGVSRLLQGAAPILQVAVCLLAAGFVLIVCRAFAGAGEPALVALVLAMLAALLEYLHHVIVDFGHYFSETAVANNLHWQIMMQIKVLDLSPEVVPHSYRFLPNGFVAFLQAFTGDFLLAKTVYRFMFGFGVLCAIYVLAREYVTRLGAVLAVALYAAVFPVSIIHYAGQLTDPMSHLSFMLALLFIRRGRDFDFAATLVLGLLAKESVLALIGCYLIAALRRGATREGLVRAAAYAVLGLALLIAVRLLVLKGGLAYEKVSGVGGEHILTNLGDSSWPAQVLFTIGIFLPMLYLHWRKLPRDLRDNVLVLLPVLLLSSLLFSWLAEARNYMPVTALLCVATAHLLEDSFGIKRPADFSQALPPSDGRPLRPE